MFLGLRNVQRVFAVLSLLGRHFQAVELDDILVRVFGPDPRAVLTLHQFLRGLLASFHPDSDLHQILAKVPHPRQSDIHDVCSKLHVSGDVQRNHLPQRLHLPLILFLFGSV